MNEDIENMKFSLRQKQNELEQLKKIKNLTMNQMLRIDTLEMDIEMLKRKIKMKTYDNYRKVKQ